MYNSSTTRTCSIHNTCKCSLLFSSHNHAWISYKKQHGSLPNSSTYFTQRTCSYKLQWYHCPPFHLGLLDSSKSNYVASRGRRRSTSRHYNLVTLGTVLRKMIWSVYNILSVFSAHDSTFQGLLTVPPTLTICCGIVLHRTVKVPVYNVRLVHSSFKNRLITIDRKMRGQSNQYNTVPQRFAIGSSKSRWR